MQHRVGGALRYGELYARAVRLATWLAGEGVRPGMLVAIAVPRSFEMVEAMLALLRLGAAYAPLDPEDPPARRKRQLEEAKIPLLLHLAGQCPEGLPEGVRAVALPEEWGALQALPQQGISQQTMPQEAGVLKERGTQQANEQMDAQMSAPADEQSNGQLVEQTCGAGQEDAAEPESLAYVMFTSGSTGTPKAVAIPHRGIIRLVEGDYLPFGPDRVFLHHSPGAFDASTLEIWGPLLHGGCCVLYPGQTPTVRELGEAIAAHQVTTLWLTAALFHLMVEQQSDLLQPVEQLLAGGEALRVSHVQRCLRELPRTKLINGYGPTECTTFACCYTVPQEFAAQEGAEAVPIGAPICRTVAVLLDEQFQPVKPGEVGELYLGGDGLALGYYQRPELTAERFLPVGPGGMRMYRTGDRARQLPTGEFVFMGRTDGCVKLRGHRIELGEVEAALARQPGVAEAVAMVWRPESGRDQLVGFVRIAEGYRGAAAVREALGAELPAYMIPARFFELEQFPLTANGKVDRKGLLAQVPSIGLVSSVGRREEAQEGSGTGAERGPEAMVARAAASAPTNENPTNEIPTTENAATAVGASMAAALERAIGRKMAETLGMASVGHEEDFFALGGDSLSAVALVAWLEREFAVEIPYSAVSSVRTLAQAVHHCRRARRGVVVLREGGRAEGNVEADSVGMPARPLFLVHGIDGRPAFYRALIQDLESSPVYGLTVAATGEMAVDETTTLEGLAAQHVARIGELQPAGPVDVAGYSYGGIVAYEIARQLVASGRPAGRVLLLDASTYGLQVDWGKGELAMHWMRRLAARIGALRRHRREEIWRYGKGRLRAALRALSGRESLAHQLVREQVEQVLAQPNEYVTQQLQRTMLAYRPGRYAGKVTVLRAQEYFNGDTAFDPHHGWRKLAAEVEVWDVPGNHVTMVKGQHAAVVAALLNELLRAEAGAAR